MNTYGYVEQNPIMYYDPDGLVALNSATGAGTGLLVCGPACAAVGGILGGIALYYAGEAAINIYNESANDSDNPHPADPNPDRNPKSDKKLRDKEAGKLPEHPHDLKGGDSTKDLFKDKKGNIFIKPKDGSGFGEPSGININDCK